MSNPVQAGSQFLLQVVLEPLATIFFLAWVFVVVFILVIRFVGDPLVSSSSFGFCRRVVVLVFPHSVRFHEGFLCQAILHYGVNSKRPTQQLLFCSNELSTVLFPAAFVLCVLPQLPPWLVLISFVDTLALTLVIARVRNSRRVFKGRNSERHC